MADLCDLFTACPGDNHRLVHRAIFSVVVHRKFGPTANLAAHPTLRKLSRRTIATGEGLGAHSVLCHA